jgi:ribosomal protein S18 acetylase RimI-like enzyme
MISWGSGAVEIRNLERTDAALFQELRLRGLTECPTAFASSYEEECELPPETVGERLDPTDKSVVLGAFEDARLVGVLGLARERRAKMAHRAFLWGMYVAPEFRRRGIGRELVAEALRHARRMPGIRRIHLGVNAANQAALALYTCMGFEEFAREPEFMLLDGTLYDEIHMAYVLHEH